MLSISVKFRNLGSDDVIIPGTANLSFSIELSSEADSKRSLVSNMGRAIVKNLSVKFDGNVILNLNDLDVCACYPDLWKIDSEERNAVRQGIIHSGGCNENCMKLRINASDKDSINKQDKTIADTYGNKFIIPLDFEMLDSAMPCCKSGLGKRLGYEITLNYYDRVIKSSSTPKKPDAKYKISNISLECDIVTQPDLARPIGNGIPKHGFVI